MPAPDSGSKESVTCASVRAPLLSALDISKDRLIRESLHPPSANLATRFIFTVVRSGVWFSRWAAAVARLSC